MGDQLRSEWRNDSDGVVGVTIYNEDGKRAGLAVKPGDSVWLTTEDRIATANGPRQQKDNPLTNGALVCVTPASDVVNRRPIGEEIGTEADDPFHPEPGDLVPVTLNGVPVQMTRASAEALRDARAKDNPPEGTPPREEVPAQQDVTQPPVVTEGEPETGVRAPGEEVGTPDAVAQAGVAKRKPKAKAAPSGRGVTVQAKPPEGLAKPATEPGTPVGVTVGEGGPQYAEAK
jgi:hypothetical protein